MIVCGKCEIMYIESKPMTKCLQCMNENYVTVWWRKIEAEYWNKCGIAQPIKIPPTLSSTNSSPPHRSSSSASSSVSNNYIRVVDLNRLM